MFQSDKYHLVVRVQIHNQRKKRISTVNFIEMAPSSSDLPYVDLHEARQERGYLDSKKINEYLDIDLLKSVPMRGEFTLLMGCVSASLNNLDVER